MKSLPKGFLGTGIRREVNKAGQLTIPKAYQDIFGIERGDMYVIFADGDGNFLLMPERNVKEMKR